MKNLTYKFESPGGALSPEWTLGSTAKVFQEIGVGPSCLELKRISEIVDSNNNLHHPGEETRPRVVRQFAQGQSS